MVSTNMLHMFFICNSRKNDYEKQTNLWRVRVNKKNSLNKKGKFCLNFYNSMNGVIVRRSSRTAADASY